MYNLNSLSHISLNADMVIIGVFVLFIALGAFAAERVKHLALSAYVGLVIATSLGTSTQKLLNSHGLNFSLDRTKVILFILPVLALSLTHAKPRKGHRNNTIMSMLMALAVAGLFISSVLFILEPASTAKILGDSTLATFVYKFRLVWLVAVPVAAVAASLSKGDKKH